jgi:hypothetical protein
LTYSESATALFGLSDATSVEFLIRKVELSLIYITDDFVEKEYIIEQLDCVWCCCA